MKNSENQNSQPKFELKSRISRDTTAKDPKAVRAVYERWAEGYNSDIAGYGYVVPKITVRSLTNLSRLPIIPNSCLNRLIEATTLSSVSGFNAPDFKNTFQTKC